MKGLSEYTDKPFSKLWEETGAFFAFSNEQFDKAKVEGVKYVSLGAGMIAPKDKAKFVLDEIDRIHEEQKKKWVNDYGVERIIKYELGNYESYYTYDISNALEVLLGYEIGITKEQVVKIFQQELPKQDL